MVRQKPIPIAIRSTHTHIQYTEQTNEKHTHRVVIRLTSFYVIASDYKASNLHGIFFSSSSLFGWYASAEQFKFMENWNRYTGARNDSIKRTWIFFYGINPSIDLCNCIFLNMDRVLCVHSLLLMAKGSGQKTAHGARFNQLKLFMDNVSS